MQEKETAVSLAVGVNYVPLPAMNSEKKKTSKVTEQWAKTQLLIYLSYLSCIFLIGKRDFKPVC